MFKYSKYVYMEAERNGARFCLHLSIHPAIDSQTFWNSLLKQGSVTVAKAFLPAKNELIIANEL